MSAALRIWPFLFFADKVDSRKVGLLPEGQSIRVVSSMVLENAEDNSPVDTVAKPRLIIWITNVKLRRAVIEPTGPAGATLQPLQEAQQAMEPGEAISQKRSPRAGSVGSPPGAGPCY